MLARSDSDTRIACSSAMPGTLAMQLVALQLGCCGPLPPEWTRPTTPDGTRIVGCRPPLPLPPSPWTSSTAAAELVHAAIPPTPTYRWPQLSRLLDADVAVKHENHTPVGAFKVRGGVVYVDRLRRRRPDIVRLVSATRGNHGQSLAFAGRRAGLDVTIVVPHGNSPDKNAAMQALGAQVVVHGEDFQAAREHAARLAEGDAAAELVAAFHPDLVLGVATYARELFAQAGPLDTVYVPVGMGSGHRGPDRRP